MDRLYDRLLDPMESWSELLDAGEVNVRRQLSYQYSTPVSGIVYLTAFTAKRTETISRIRSVVGGTGAAATPTLCKLGVYEINSDGSLTLVAATANTTSLWATPWTRYTTNLTAPWGKVRGKRYATALLIVTGAAVPLIIGGGNNNGQHLAEGPWVTFEVIGQTDLPANIAAASLAATSRHQEIAVLT